MSDQQMFCSKCNNKLRKGSNECRKCNTLTTPRPSQPYTAVPQQQVSGNTSFEHSLQNASKALLLAMTGSGQQPGLQPHQLQLQHQYMNGPYTASVPQFSAPIPHHTVPYQQYPAPFPQYSSLQPNQYALGTTPFMTSFSQNPSMVHPFQPSFAQNTSAMSVNNPFVDAQSESGTKREFDPQSSTRSNKRRRTQRSAPDPKRGRKERTGRDFPFIPEDVNTCADTPPSKPLDPPTSKPNVSKPKEAKISKTVVENLPGNCKYQRSRTACIGWCYKHHHALVSACEVKGPANKFLRFNRPLGPPVSVPDDYSPIQKGQVPQSYMAAIIELAHLGENLYGYLRFIKLRDEAQKAFVKALEADVEASRYEWAADDLRLMSDVLPMINVVVQDYYFAIQALAKHCYLSFCNSLLRDMHAFGIALEINDCTKSIDGPSVVLGRYQSFCQARQRRFNNVPVDLEIRVPDQPMWLELVTHIQSETDAFNAQIRTHRRRCETFIAHADDTPYRPFLELLTSGGFGPVGPPSTSVLPRFVYLDNLAARMPSLLQHQAAPENAWTGAMEVDGPAAENDTVANTNALGAISDTTGPVDQTEDGPEHASLSGSDDQDSIHLDFKDDNNPEDIG